MFWRKREPRFTVAEHNAMFAMIAENVTAMNEEARKAHMVDLGMIPQEHLTRKDLKANLQKLQLAGHERMGRHVAEAGSSEDPDLTAREE